MVNTRAYGDSLKVKSLHLSVADYVFGKDRIMVDYLKIRKL